MAKVRVLTPKKNVRLQSGCVPYKIIDGKIMVMLITSSTSGKWTIPTGGLEPNMTAEDNAQKETFEEAGVVGKITHDLGSFTFTKSSTNKKQTVKVFGLRVKKELKNFPEKDTRDRTWLPIKEAKKLSNRGNKQIELLQKDLKNRLKKGKIFSDA